MNIEKLKTFTEAELESRKENTKRRIERYKGTGRDAFIKELELEVSQIAEVLLSGDHR